MTTTKRISELQSISNVELDSVFVVVQNGTTHKVSYDTILLQSRANDWATLDAVLNDPNQTFGKSLLPSSNEYYSLGSLAQRWNDIYLSNSTIYLGDATISAQGASLVLSAGARVGEIDILANDSATVDYILSNSSAHFTAEKYFDSNVYTNSIIPQGDHDLGSYDYPWRDLWMSEATIRFKNGGTIRSSNGSIIISSLDGSNVNPGANDSATYQAILANSQVNFTASKLFEKDLTVLGNLYVLGQLFEANVETLVIEDSSINLNFGGTVATAEGAGLYISSDQGILANLYYTSESRSGWRVSGFDIARFEDAHSNDWATWVNAVSLAYSNDWATWSNLNENSYATWSNLNENSYATWSNLNENSYATWSNLSENSYATWSNLSENSYATWSNLNENSYATWSNLNENSYATWSNLSENSYATWSNLNENSYATWSNLNENSYATWSNLNENSYATWSNLSENSYATWSNLNENSYATWSNLNANDWATFVNTTSSAHANDWLTLDAILNDSQTMFSKDKSFLANIYVYGNLYVFGNTFQANVGTLLVQDNTINLNFGGTTVSAENSGLHVEGDSHTIVGSFHYRSESLSGWRIGKGDLSISSTSADDVARFGDMHANDWATWSNLSENSYATWSNLNQNSYATWSNLSENSYATWGNLNENSYATWSNLNANDYMTWSNLSENIYATWSNLQVSYRLHGNLISLGTSNLDFVGVGVNVYFTGGNLTVNISGGATTEEAFANDWATYTNLISNSAVYITDNVAPTLGEGFLWWNSSDGQLYIRYVDGDSAQWIPASPPGSVGGDSSKAIARDDSSTSKIYPLFVDSFSEIPQTIKSNGQIHYNTFTNTLSLPNVNTQSVTATRLSYLSSVVNKTNIVAEGIQSVVDFDLQDYSAKYLTSNSISNCTVNFRANSSISLNSLMRIGDIIETRLFVKQGADLFYANQVSIDGTLISTKWRDGTLGVSTADAIDLYRYNVVKTGNAIFTVLANRDLYS